jgi:hypothetical protein
LAIFVDAATGNSSSSSEENVGFWIDEAPKMRMARRLSSGRFDARWISAARDDVSYELDNGNLTYASSTTKDGVTTIIIAIHQLILDVAKEVWLIGGRLASTDRRRPSRCGSIAACSSCSSHGAKSLSENIRRDYKVFGA